MGRIRRLEKRKKKLLKALEITKQRKKQVIDSVRAVRSLYRSGRISEQEYYKRERQVLASRTLEQWVKYYDDYVVYYKKNIRLCDGLVKESRKEAEEKRVREEIEERIEKKKEIRAEEPGWLRRHIVSILIVLIVVVLIGILVSLLFIFRPDAAGFFKKAGERVFSVFKPAEVPDVLDIEVADGPILPEIPEGVPPEDYETPIEYEDPEVLVNLKTEAEEFGVYSKAKQGQAVLGKPVKWKVKVVSDDPASFELKLPIGSDVKKIKRIEEESEIDITDSSSVRKRGIFRRRVEVEVHERGREYEVEYETEAPVAVEEEISKTRKKVTISSPENLHYKEVFSFAKIPEILNVEDGGSVHVYQVEENRNKIRKRIQASVYDTDENGLADTVEWVAPYLSEAVFIIVITKAEHLDSNKEFISDIYPEVFELDGIWSEPIYHNEYIRVTFERELTNENDITFYVRNIEQSETLVEVYYMDGEKITEFPVITEEGEYKVLLTDLPDGYKSAVFDLRIKNLQENIGGYLEFDQIIDPPTPISGCGQPISSNTEYILTADDSYASHCFVLNPRQNVILDLNGHTFTYTGASTHYGFLAQYSKNITVKNGVFRNFNYGVRLYYTNHSVVENVTFEGGSRGIGLYNNAYNNTLISNRINGTSYAGIFVYGGSQNNTLINNSVVNNFNYGILFQSSSNNTFVNNNFSNNPNGAGIYIYSSHNNFGINNTADSNAYGVVLGSYSYNNTLINTNIRNCTSTNYGCIYFKQAGSNLISGGIVNLSENTALIFLNGSSNNTFSDMRLSESATTDVNLTYSLNNTFLNVSYDVSKEVVGPNSKLIRKWYYQANVTYNTDPINGANLSAYNKTGIPDGWQFNLTTGADGLTNRTEIIEYININDIKQYYSKYIISTTNVTLLEVHEVNVTWEAEQTGGGGEGSFGGLVFDEIFLLFPNKVPNLTVIFPLNNTAFASPGWALLNWSMSDPEASDLEVWIWGSNESSNALDEHSLLYHRKGMPNGEFTYNWTSPVVRPDDTTVLLFHFDNRSDFGESDGWPGYIYDFSGTGNTGYLGNISEEDQVPTWNQSGKFGGAFDFHGNAILKDHGECIRVNDSASLDFTAGMNFTIAVWVRSNATLGDSDIIRKGSSFSTAGIGPWWKLEWGDASTNNVFHFNTHIDGIPESSVRSSPGYTDGNWHHVVAMRRGTNLMLFVDGVFVDNAAIVTNSFAGNSNLSIGCKDSLNDDYFNGSIDEVAIWNRSLSNEEVYGLYNLTYGKYYWQINISDGKDTNSSGLYQFNLTEPPDLIPPEIIIISPDLYRYYTTQSVGFNVSLNENGTWCGFSLNGEDNVTMTEFNKTYFNFTNYTMTDATTHEVVFSCNDTSGNMASTLERTFYVDTGFVPVSPNITFVNPTPPNDTVTSNRTIVINISIEKQTYSLGEMIYNWNGTNYTVYSDSLIFSFSFNNLSALGENDSFVRDVTGKHNATCFGLGCPNFTTSGKFDGAFEYFNNPGGYGNSEFTILDSPDFDLYNLTVMAWVKTVNAQTPGDDYEIFGLGGSGSGNELTFGLTDDGGNQGAVRFRVLNGATTTAFGTSSLADMEWHHIVGVRNSSSYLIYVDGALETITTDQNPGELITPTGISMIGGVPEPDQQETFNGSIDNLMLWNRVLSEEEINQMYFTNLYQYDEGKFALYVNQSKNATEVLDFGPYTYQATVSDVYGNENKTNQSLITIINPHPIVSLELPFYSDILNDTNVTFRCSATDEDEVANITLYGNWTTDWHANQTKETSLTYNYSIVHLNLTDQSTYIWNCYSCDFFNNCGFALSNYTFLVDTSYAPPFTSIWLPTDAQHNIDGDVTEYVNKSANGISIVEKDEYITVNSWNDSLAGLKVLRYAIAHVEIHNGDTGAVINIQTDNENPGTFETCGACSSIEMEGVDAGSLNLTCHLTYFCGIDTNTEINNLNLRVLVTDPGGKGKAITNVDYIWLDVAYKNKPVVESVRTYNNNTLDLKAVFEIGEGIYVNASVTDEDGRADLDEVLITFVNTTGGVIVNNATMLNYSSFAEGNIYNYTWEIPDSAQNGMWTVIVSGVDKSGNVNAIIYNFDVFVNQPPVIIWVDDLPDVDPLVGSMRNVSFNFTVYDENGATDLVDTSARANFTKTGYVPTVTRENITCEHLTDFDTYYANYSCTIGMWYFDEAGTWDITVLINDSEASYAQNDTQTFTYKTLSEFGMFPVYINWSTLQVDDANVEADNKINITNLGNVQITQVRINATNLTNASESDFPNDFIPANNFTFSNTSTGESFCNGAQLVESDYVYAVLAVNYSDSNETSFAFDEIGFCFNYVPDVYAQQYKSVRPWRIETIFSFMLSLLKVLGGLQLLIVAVKRKKKKKKVMDVLDKRLKERHVDFEGLLSLDESLRKKYNLGVEELLEIARRGEVEEIQIPIVVFKQDLGPAEALCKYLKENLGLRFSEIARLLNRDERTVWINYRNAVKKKSEKIEVEKKVLISIKIFSDRRLSILESLVDYLKKKKFRNNEIGEILNRDQRNIYTLYSRARKKLAN
jgi:parallel beta-helix repeat protein